MRILTLKRAFQRAPASVYLRLGRVSNLPTVWTNVLAGAVLGGATAAAAGTVLLVMAGVSCCYLAGMNLNDAFDRAIDARERPERPIPSGAISAGAVFAIGFILLALGLGLLALCGQGAALAGCALAATILAYDAWHKHNPASPLVMGACRALVYVAAAQAVGGASTSGTLALAALAMLAHVAGLTYAARQESLDRIDRLWPLAMLAVPLFAGAWAAIAMPFTWPFLVALACADAVALRRLVRRAARGDVPKAVAQLIAATALLDAAVIAAASGSVAVALACIAAYALTRVLQRVIAGT